MKKQTASSAADSRGVPIERPADRRALAGLLFLLVAAGPVLHTLVLVLQHRFPAGHDGFQYITTQWYFLNNAAQSGEVAQWMPYMTEGTVATFWYGVQASFCQNILMCGGKLLRHFDLLHLLYWGMCVDELILAAGSWLLCRRFFRSRLTAVFVCTCVAGSSLWLDQTYWNFRLYYAVPLILHFGHRFLETIQWRYGFLCLNLLAMQTLGALPYFIPVTSFVICAYFALYVACNWPAVWPRLRALRWRWSSLMWIVLAGLSLACAYKYLTIGTDQLVNYSPGRTGDQKTDLRGFMEWGGTLSWQDWSEMVLGLTPWLDFSLYAGMLTAPLGILGALVIKRQRLHLLLLAILVALFAHATFVSAALFHVWPMMKYFRHLSLVSPLVRVLLCFVAGAGFEWLFLQESGGGWKVAAHILLGGAMLVTAFCLAILANPWGANSCMQWLAVNPGFSPRHATDAAEVISRLHYSAAIALLAGTFLLLSGLVSTRARAVSAWLAIGLALVDIYHYKLVYLLARSDVMGLQARELTQPSPMPFHARRVAEITADNPRIQKLLSFSRFEGMQYYTLNNFIFLDEVAHVRSRADFALRPFDQFLRVCFGQELTSLAERPGGNYYTNFPFQTGPSILVTGLRFPLEAGPATKFAGLSCPKIQFFSEAYEVGSEGELARMMSLRSFKGDLLFLLPSQDAGGAGAATRWHGQQPFDANERLELVPQVVRFDANNLILRVTNSYPQRVWMFYSDVWHPNWSAVINGTPAPVHRAAMAYKAVLLQPGPNTVHFRFGSRLMSLLLALFSLQSLLWLFLAAWLVFQILRGNEPVDRSAFSESGAGNPGKLK